MAKDKVTKLPPGKEDLFLTFQWFAFDPNTPRGERYKNVSQDIWKPRDRDLTNQGKFDKMEKNLREILLKYEEDEG